MAEFRIEVEKMPPDHLHVYGENAAGPEGVHVVTLQIFKEDPGGNVVGEPLDYFIGGVAPNTKRLLASRYIGTPTVRAWAVADYVEFDTKEVEADAIPW